MTVPDAEDDMPVIIRDRSAARDRIGTSSRERLRAARLAAGWSPRTDAVPGAAVTPAAWTTPAVPLTGKGTPPAPVTPSVPVTPVTDIDQVIRGPLFRPPGREAPQPLEPPPAQEVAPTEDDWFWRTGTPASQGVADPFAFLHPAPPDPTELSPTTDPFGLPLPAPIAPGSAAARHARGGGSAAGRRAWRMPAVTGAAGVLAGIVLGVTGSQHATPAPAEAAVAPSTVTVTAPTVPPVTVTVTAAVATAPARPSPVRYADCDAVTRAGAAPLYRGETGYRAALDPDGDGIACEQG
jgi:hypothetical protein